MKIKILPDEYWWGCSVRDGHQMPFTRSSQLTLNINGTSESDQFSPFLLSSKGRYLWGDRPFSVEVREGFIETTVEEGLTLEEGHGTLRNAYQDAMKKHFPFERRLPGQWFFQRPQYNTWIELGTDQTADRIPAYASQILENGYPAGILMIDGGWQEDYGLFEFNRRKIPDPAGMIRRLHEMGFQVMLWTSPIVASAGANFKLLRDRGYLIRRPDGEPAVRKWWSGYSCVLDFSNPEACAWYWAQLDGLMRDYGVDGYKFDAGDYYFYQDGDRICVPGPAREQTTRFNRVGVRYPLNEFRAAYAFGGQPIVARLHDKYHTWNDFGLNTLIPHTITQGLLGYAYCCPDMVGGGILDCFNKGQKLDEELFVRWAQANALMGMMQLSVAPWRVLDPENAALVKEAVLLHARMGEEIFCLAAHAAETGDPIVRCLEYVFPGQGLTAVTDEFLLGDSVLAAPVLTQGQISRTVVFPAGKWADPSGRVWEGPCTVTVDAPLDTLPWFRKQP